MKTTVAALSLGVGLMVLAACRVTQAGVAEPPPIPSTYSAAALYDLGNFYARAGRPAMAVLNYERARVLAPADPDLQANLRSVRQSLGVPDPARGWLSRHARWANPNLLYWVGVLGMALAGGSLLLRRTSSTNRLALGACAAFGGVLVALALLDAAATASMLRESVAMVATPASASPISGLDPLFTVPLADVVSVQEDHGAYSLVVDSQGRRGWVASEDLQPVIPAAPVSRGIRKVIRASAT